MTDHDLALGDRRGHRAHPRALPAHRPQDRRPVPRARLPARGGGRGPARVADPGHRPQPRLRPPHRQCPRGHAVRPRRLRPRQRPRGAPRSRCPVPTPPPTSAAPGSGPSSTLSIDDFAKATGGRPVLCLERLAALYPVCGAQHLMQQMWDSAQSDLAGPVLVLIPGTLVASRVYRFVDLRDEFMYRGDLL
jgi:hypothetical protein